MLATEMQPTSTFVHEGYEVHRFHEPAAFLQRARQFLLAHEAEHTLILGLTHQFIDAGRAPAGALFATVERAGAVQGCVFRTPPEKLVLTRMPLDAIPAVDAFAGDVYASIPAVLAPEAEGATFAALWAARRHVGVRAGMRQGIHQLTRLVPPPNPSPGALRCGTLADLPLVTEWVAHFAEDASHPVVDPEAVARPRLAAGTLWLWEDQQPVCMAARMGRTAHGDRIGFVFTPRALRGKGYASACVAALTKQVLEEGFRFACLYTDLANPTSNAIYHRLGYVQIAEVMDHEFAGRG